MILREVTLTIQSLSQGKSDEDAASHRQFLSETACVSDLYRRCLPKLTTRETAKVLIELTEDPGRITTANIRRLPQVTWSPWHVRLADYWPLDELQRKRFALEALHHGLWWLAEQEGWPTEPLRVAYEACLERQLVHDFVTKKAVANPSRTATLVGRCEFGPREARFTALIRRGRQEVRRIDLGTVVPESYIVESTLQSLRWVDDRHLQIQIELPYDCEPTIYQVFSSPTEGASHGVKPDFLPRSAAAESHAPIVDGQTDLITLPRRDWDAGPWEWCERLRQFLLLRLVQAREVVPLTNEGAQQLREQTDAMNLPGPPHWTNAVFERIERVKLSRALPNERELQRVSLWLQRCPMTSDAEVYLSWDATRAAQTTWNTFLSHWSALAEVPETVLHVFDASRRWVVMFSDPRVIARVIR